jgi:hypothetical protein
VKIVLLTFASSGGPVTNIRRGLFVVCSRSRLQFQKAVFFVLVNSTHMSQIELRTPLPVPHPAFSSAPDN